MKHIAVIGLMGVGKTTTAEALAAELGLTVRDSDRDIEAQTGRSGREIAATDGVPALHRLEADVLLSALAADQRSIITAAGSTIESAECRAALAERATVVWLSLPTEVVASRLRAGTHRRAMSDDELRALVDRRRPLFTEAADLIVDASGSTAVIVAEVYDFLGPDDDPRASR